MENTMQTVSSERIPQVAALSCRDAIRHWNGIFFLVVHHDGANRVGVVSPVPPPVPFSGIVLTCQSKNPFDCAQTSSRPFSTNLSYSG